MPDRPAFLVNDRFFVAVQPGLARALGGSSDLAAALQLMYFLLGQPDTKAHDGHEWVCKPAARWGSMLGTSAPAAQYRLRKLCGQGVVVHIECTSLYRIDYGAVAGRLAAVGSELSPGLARAPTTTTTTAPTRRQRQPESPPEAEAQPEAPPDADAQAKPADRFAAMRERALNR